MADIAAILGDLEPATTRVPVVLVVVDGEEAITDMVTQLWPEVPIQRCS